MTDLQNTITPPIAYSECYVQPFFSFFNADNMAIMKTFKDKEFDLAIVDPPYGIGFSDYERGSSGIKVKERFTKNGKKDWDYGLPTIEYFSELKRISKNQIIWGGNYFDLQPTQCFLFWYKQNPVPNFADGELAWTSFNKPALCFDYRYYGNIQGKSSMKETKIHPTQKPIELYDWILKNFANENDKIIDTHLGSGSIAIAIDKANTLDKKNLTFVGIELDPDYFRAAVERFKNHKRQCVLF
jgi:site-specific DNA-methyltransferase (adenine-specific)